jgi:hypothetical protein
VFETNDEQQAIHYEQRLIAHYGLESLTNQTLYGKGARKNPPHTFRFRVDAITVIERAGLKQADLATAAGITRFHLNRRLHGKGNLNPAFAHRIARAFVQITEIDKATAFDVLFEEAR